MCKDLVKEILGLEGVNTYLHTSSLDSLETMLKYGFALEYNFNKTTDWVANEFNFNFWKRYRKHYGGVCYVLQIPLEIFDKDEFFDLVTDKNDLDELIKILEEDGSEVEFQHLIPPCYIRGYFKGKEYYENDKFDINKKYE